MLSALAAGKDSFIRTEHGPLCESQPSWTTSRPTLPGHPRCPPTPGGRAKCASSSPTSTCTSRAGGARAVPAGLLRRHRQRRREPGPASCSLHIRRLQAPGQVRALTSPATPSPRPIAPLGQPRRWWAWPPRRCWRRPARRSGHRRLEDSIAALIGQRRPPRRWLPTDRKAGQAWLARAVVELPERPKTPGDTRGCRPAEGREPLAGRVVRCGAHLRPGVTPGSTGGKAWWRLENGRKPIACWCVP